VKLGLEAAQKQFVVFNGSTLVGYGVHPHSGLEELEK
jgi:hypothetical protein